MNALRKALADYFAVRRALGFKLYRAEKLLGQFLTFVEDRGEDHLTTEAALAWATLPQAGRTWAFARLSVVRRFANHLRGIDPATEVPPTHLLVQQKGPSHALPIFGVGYRGPHRRSRDASDAAPSGDISDIDRFACGDRNAGWGSDRSRPRRFRLCHWTTHHSERKVRQVSPITATSEYRGRTD
jgi:hypothetical protein